MPSTIAPSVQSHQALLSKHMQPCQSFFISQPVSVPASGGSRSGDVRQIKAAIAQNSTAKTATNTASTSLATSTIRTCAIVA